MNKVLHRFVLISVVVLLLLTGCGNKKTPVEDVLEGHWMDENGDTITFIGDGSVMWYGSSYSYTIYDTNKVMIKNQDAQVGNYSFSVKSEVLELKDLDLNFTKTLYGNEDKQERILKELREAELALLEAEMKEEQEYYEAIEAYEYETELDLYYTYKERCLEEYNQSTTEDDRAFFQSEIDAVQERIDVLETKNANKIDAHSFEKACDWISWYILPEDISTSENLLFDDEGRQYLNNPVDNSLMIGYLVRVRLGNDDMAPTYGVYAIQFSTTNIYEYDAVKDEWTFIYSLNILGN